MYTAEYQMHSLRRAEAAWAAHCSAEGQTDSTGQLLKPHFSSKGYSPCVISGYVRHEVNYLHWSPMHYDTNFAIFESKDEELCLQNYYPHPPGQHLSCSHAPTSTPRPTLPSFQKICFIPLLSFRVTTTSHTQKHGCRSTGHLFPQKTAWPLAAKADFTPGEAAKAIRKQTQVYHTREIFLSEAYFQQIFS